jgi:3-phosphoshikimate 1-carboxyvinyltransferase
MRGVEDLATRKATASPASQAGLRACGVQVEEEMDGMTVQGRGRPPAGGGDVRTHGDHRVAMAHLVLGLAAERPVTVTGAEMIATSFPGFAELMQSLGAEIEPA